MVIYEGSALIQRVSKYNDDYYCIIEKVELLPGIIRVFIDERGDNSLGRIQHPISSRLVIICKNASSEEKSAIDGKFSIYDEHRQCTGYIDFKIDSSFLKSDHIIDHQIDSSLEKSEHIIGFKYGNDGYSTAKLFKFNQQLFDKFYKST